MLKIAGIVIKGKGKGKKLSFPTANIPLSEPVESGVYTGKTRVDGKKYLSAIFIPEGGQILETHLLDFSEDLYGQKIEVEIFKKIREVRRFKNDEELIKQIKKDVEFIKSCESTNPLQIYK